MATAEDRRHIERLIKTHKRVIQELELKQATLGIDTPSHVLLELDERRLNLAELETHLTGPKILAETRQAVAKLYDNNVEFLIAQIGSLQNRQIKTEERQDGLGVEVGELKKTMLVVVDDMRQDKATAQHGRTRNFWLFIVVIGMLLLIGGAVFALAVRVLA